MQNHKTYRINLIEKAVNLCLGYDSFFFYTESKGNKSKNKQVGLYPTKKLLHSKGNHQQNEKSSVEWKKVLANHISNKKIFANHISNNHISKKNNIKIIQRAHTTQ